MKRKESLWRLACGAIDSLQGMVSSQLLYFSGQAISLIGTWTGATNADPVASRLREFSACGVLIVIGMAFAT